MPYLQLPDLKLFYTVDDHTDPWTRPETIVFIHGFTECTEAWRCWVPHFSRYYRVVRYDLRGFGQSGPVPADFPFTTEMVVNDLARLIEHVSPDAPVHVVGGKSGGIPALKIALDRPELIQSATLVSSPIKGPSITGWLEHMDAHGTGSWARWTMGGRLGSKMPAAGVDWWVNMMGRTAVSTAYAYLRWVGGVDLTPELPRVRRPVLVLANDSPRRGLAEFRAYQQAIPGAELKMIDVDGY
ncbi:MAG TPA: alpha/beta fold hydrolase, partial [Burkholderiales bacterium]|nr:alpha/beta fold hydrolase [Burkholderiales bacterium]